MNKTEHCGSLAVSWLGCASLIKMNILPLLLYPISMIPVLFLNRVMINPNVWISSFTCNKCGAKLKIIVLQLSGSLGGLDPNIRTYQLWAQMNYIQDGIVSDPVSTYAGIDTSLSKYPLMDLL